MPLLDPASSIVVVIDVQPGFIRSARATAGDRAQAEATVARAAWLIGFAGLRNIPVVVVEEGPDRAGVTDDRLLSRAPAGTPVLRKTTFSAARSLPVLEALAATGRQTAVLVGFETDTCVAQTAEELRDRGYRVVVVEDATYSASDVEHLRGLAWIQQRTIETVHCKGLVLQWCGVVNRAIATIEEARRRFGAPPFAL
jgi:nicotinamidase-related amidase